MKPQFDFTKLISPAILGGETKNQDRADYVSPTLSACVCDGVTSSPYADRAAELGVLFSLVLFNHQPEHSLNDLVQILNHHRQMAMAKGIQIPDSAGTATGMYQDILQQKLQSSFQTTLAAVQCRPQTNHLQAKMIWCGDSGIFIYSAAGDLLFSNFSCSNWAPDHAFIAPSPYRVIYDPDHPILTRTLGPLDQFPELVKGNRIKKGHLCQVISNPTNALPAHPQFPSLNAGDLLAVPDHLFSRLKDPDYRDLGTVIYSRQIHPVHTLSAFKPVELIRPGNFTAVLPDDFNRGRWSFIEEQVPLDVSILLCSDGFYHSQKTPEAMWSFLNDYHQATDRTDLERRLHLNLQETVGDDDITFIWIHPRSDTRNS